MKKLIKKILMIIGIIILAFVVAVVAFMQQAKFGKMPSGERLERVKKSPNFRDGKFQNLSHTPDLTEGVSYYAVMKEFLFEKSKRATPIDSFPAKRIDLLNLPPNKDILVWFGHSSYFMQLDGKKFLVDPVLSGSASPLRFTTPSFRGSDVYTVDDFPEIDYLLLSHDHYDHLDYETILELKPKVKKVICGLGVGEHFEYWGYDKEKIIEKDWEEEVILDSGFVVNVVPARHFSGRGFQRNGSLWVSFVLQTPSNKIFIGGDSGYDTHFAKIGDKFGAFDLVILECGQYDKSWRYIHLLPEEIIQAAQDLKAKRLMPVHWGKFVLGNHAWDEPILKITDLGRKNNMPLLTPMIGEEVNLKDSTQTFSAWWEGIK
jgi:L-ascorbate metabolism protein UlaG (beta-lactamase superfamily)